MFGNLVAISDFPFSAMDFDFDKDFIRPVDCQYDEMNQIDVYDMFAFASKGVHSKYYL